MGGLDKGALTFDGATFLERIAGELGGLEELFLSVDQAERFPGCTLPMVEDIFSDGGPLAGLHAALTACRSGALMAVSCDMPLFRRGVTDYLAAFLHPGVDAVVAKSRDGGIHPLCGIYRKSVAGLLEDLLAQGERRMMTALDRMRVKYAPLAHSAYPDGVVANVNTRQAQLALEWGMPLVSVCGVKNSGKTTFLEGVIPLLRERGLQVGVLKHDGHDFSPDVPGTDSHRLAAAGAVLTGVYSGFRYTLSGLWEKAAPERLLPAFAEVDLVLLEGGKHLNCPKLELVRGAVSRQPVSQNGMLLALCTDVPISSGEVPVLGLEDYRAAAEIIMNYLRCLRKPPRGATP